MKGDSGYGQQPYVFVPIEDTNTEPEERYNSIHRKARHRVERCIGVLKCRFRCLLRQRTLIYSPSVAGIYLARFFDYLIIITNFSGKIIIACAILNNIMIENNYPLPARTEIADQMNREEDEDNDDGYVYLPPANIKRAGDIARNNMIRDHFM